MTATALPRTKDDFRAIVQTIELDLGYVRPAAYAIGWATITDGPGGLDMKMLDADFEHICLVMPPVSGSVDLESVGMPAMLSSVLEPLGGGLRTGMYVLGSEQIRDIMHRFRPHLEGTTWNGLKTLVHMSAYLQGDPDNQVTGVPGHLRVPVVAVISSFDDDVVSVGDAYLRLYLQSMGAPIRRMSIANLEEKLNVVVWTSVGPIDPDCFERVRFEARRQGQYIHVYSVGRIPPMADYVLRPDVLLSDANTVQLGAKLRSGDDVPYGYVVSFRTPLDRRS